MLKKVPRLVLNISNSFSSTSTPLTYDIYAACCLQRFPVIQPELNDIEKRAKEMFRLMEVRNSLLSDHELRHFNDKAILKKKAKAAAEDALTSNVESGPFITAVEAEDMWEGEKNDFKIGNRITEADENNDLASTQRRLDKTLIFAVEQKVGNGFKLILPQVCLEITSLNING